jgi:hypothetical protein
MREIGFEIPAVSVTRRIRALAVASPWADGETKAGTGNGLGLSPEIVNVPEGAPR